MQAELLTLRALQNWALGRTDEALQFARAARLADPLSAACVLREADLLAKAGQLDAAVALYDKVIHDAPDDPRAYFGLAEARRLQSRFDEAIEARRRAASVGGGEFLDDRLLRGEEGYAQIERHEAQLATRRSSAHEPKRARMFRRSTTRACTPGWARGTEPLN